MTLTSPVVRTGPTALQRATAALQPPFAVVDLAAMRAITDDMVRRAGGKPIRVASKSVRCREILCNVLDRSGYQGILAFTLPEALWLAASFDDVLVAYPTADTDALARLAADERLASRVTIARHRAGPPDPDPRPLQTSRRAVMVRACPTSPS